jgi:hypothetical protein
MDTDWELVMLTRMVFHFHSRKFVSNNFLIRVHPPCSRPSRQVCVHPWF